jgi:hypothetical protein
LKIKTSDSGDKMGNNKEPQPSTSAAARMKNGRNQQTTTATWKGRSTKVSKSPEQANL